MNEAPELLMPQDHELGAGFPCGAEHAPHIPAGKGSGGIFISFISGGTQATYLKNRAIRSHKLIDCQIKKRKLTGSIGTPFLIHRCCQAFRKGSWAAFSDFNEHLEKITISYPPSKDNRWEAVERYTADRPAGTSSKEWDLGPGMRGSWCPWHQMKEDANPTCPANAWVSKHGYYASGSKEERKTLNYLMSKGLY